MPRDTKRLPKRRFSTDREIQNTLSDLRERLKYRHKVLVFSLIAFILTVAAVTVFLVYNRSLTQKALSLEAEGQKIFYGLSQQKETPVDERYKNALQKFTESYNTKKNPRVLYYIANCYYEMGNYDEAIKTLTELTGRFSDPYIVSLAYYKNAMAYLKKNDTENALKSLNLLLNLKGSLFQDLALLESGLILEASGKSEEAKGFYRQIIEKYPQSIFVGEAKKKVGE